MWTSKIEVVKYSYIQAIVLSHYLFIPMSLPTCRHASEDREKRNFFDVGEIFFFSSFESCERMNRQRANTSTIYDTQYLHNKEVV